MCCSVTGQAKVKRKGEHGWSEPEPGPVSPEQSSGCSFLPLKPDSESCRGIDGQTSEDEIIPMSMASQGIFESVALVEEDLGTVLRSIVG